MRRKLFLSIFCGLVLVHVVQVSGGPAPQPLLNISSSGAGLVTVSWQDTNNWLQTSPLLSVVPFSWLNFSATPVVSGGSNSITIPATGPEAFFRLVNSPFLPPPTRLSIDWRNDGSFILLWDNVPGAASYKLYLASVSGVNKLNYSSLTNGAVLAGITSNYITLSTLTPGTRYYFVITAVSPAAEESAESNEASGIYGPHASVHGSVYTELFFGTNLTQVSVPGVALSLANISNSTIHATVFSDGSGNFSFPDQPAGDYQLCWRAAGFISDCLTQSVTISNIPVDVDPIAIYALINSTNGLVYGQVLFQNGTPALQQDSFFQINASPVVALIGTNNRPFRLASVNLGGQYLILNVPRTNNLTLRATLENANVVTNINTFVTGEANIVFSNSPPTIHVVVATLNGAPAFRVPPGANVQVTAYADDPDGDALNFQWFTPYGPLASPASSNISWTLPNDLDGFDYLFVRASDGKGGYDTARLALTTNPYLIFSGQVIGSDTAAPLANAHVQLNNFSTATDTNGYFSFLVTETNEYDIAITSSGYVPLTKVWKGEVPDREYRLQKISDAPCTYDASSPILASNSVNVTLYIPPNSLTDSNGNTYFGCVSVALDTSNPCATNSEYSGGNLTLDGSVLSPYLFVNIDVRGSNGSPLGLSPGAFMQLVVPQGAGCFDPSNSAPVGFFAAPDQAPPRWAPLAEGTKFDNNGFPIYIINVTNVNFPPGNSPFGPSTVAQADAKGALLISADRTLHVPFTVSVYKPNGTVLKQFEDILYQTPQDMGGTPNNKLAGQVIPDLPAGEVIIKILDLRQSPGKFFNQGTEVQPGNKTVIQIITNTVTADATNTVIAGLGVGTGRAAQLADLTQAKTAQLNFLTTVDLPKGAKIAANDPDAPFNQYYKLVDPDNKKDTFAKWQTENGWPAAGAGIGNFVGPNAGKNDDAFALYFNAADLGAGRRMGMKINGDNAAYYVATYASLTDAEAGKELKYIVCMEYSPHPTLAATVGYIKFYAYDKDGNRTGVVPDEDRHRSTYVPYVCMACHGGGTFTIAATLKETSGAESVKTRKGDVDGQFVAFDTANYTFGNAAGFQRKDLFQKKVFTSLNQGLLKSAGIMPDNLTKLINALVAGDKNYTTSQPAGWEADAASVDLYNKLYAVSCRSCHVTQGDKNWSKAAKFKSDRSQYATVPSFTKKGKGLMPQAQRAHSIFWGSATGNKINANVFSQPQALSGAAPAFVP